jgi:hypothetical protein
MQMKIGDNVKVLVAEVVYSKDNQTESSEYGCRMVTPEGGQT